VFFKIRNSEDAIKESEEIMKVKKIIGICIAIMLVIAMSACNGGPPPAPPQEENGTEQNGEEVQAADPVELLIGAAMSLADVTVDLAEAFERENEHVTLVFTYASSGALQGQIEEGAPIDIFMSAAVAQMRNLEEQGLIYGESRNVVRNTVALIVPADSDIEIESFEDVALDIVGIVGVGDPEAMPIGRFAQEVFVYFGVADEVYAKAVIASDVRQILTWVELGEVDAGVVFTTDAITTDDVRIIEIADPAFHSPSINPVGIVADSPHIEEAQKFVDFLFSSTARAIFESHGFSMY